MFMNFSIFSSEDYIPIWKYMGRPSSLHMTQPAGKERISNNLSNLVVRKFISLFLLLKVESPSNSYVHPQSHFWLQILLPVHHEITVECKPVYLKCFHMFSHVLHMFTAWVKHQIVDINVQSLS